MTSAISSRNAPPTENTRRYEPGSRSFASSVMRPSRAVSPWATRCSAWKSAARVPARGLPNAVSRTCVERVACAIARIILTASALNITTSAADCAQHPYRGRSIHVLRASRGGCGAEDVRRHKNAAAVREPDHPRALERRGRLGADGRTPHRRRLRESHELPRAGTDPRVPRWHLRDGDPRSVRVDALREQGRPARGEPL